MKKLEYKKAIASVLLCDEDRIFLYWKGRIALYAFLKALELKENDEVIIPAFTCVVVPNAIIYAGLKPIYVDISPSTYNMDVKLIESKITSRTRVIICQNTFGLSSGLEEIASIAKKYNLITIEDCTHGFGGFYNGKPNGSSCQAAFFSTQWNKPFSTGIGGFLVVNDDSILPKVKKLEFNKTKPKLIEKSLLSFLLVFRKLFINKFTQSTLVKIYRELSKHNLVLGSNRGEELNSTKAPIDYFKDISTIQIMHGIKSIKKLSNLNELRRKNAFSYTQYLKLKNKNHVDEDYFPNHIFLKYPLLVKDREVFFKLAQRFNLTLGDWFLSPLHPVKDDLSQWGLIKNDFPIASIIAQQIVNLPTDIDDTSDVLKFLEKNLELIV